MPVFLEQISFDVAYHQLRHPPVIVNDLTMMTEDEREFVSNMITTRYSADMVTLLPTCRCGFKKGEYSSRVRCPRCGEFVKSSSDDDIEPAIWMRAPLGIERLISPNIMSMLKTRLRVSGFNVLQWLIDTDYRAPVKQPEVISKIVQKGIARGYNNFVTNFDQIIETLFSFREFGVKRGQFDYLAHHLAVHRSSIFSSYLPIPNKALLILEKTHLGIYVDPNVIDAVDAIKMMVGIDKTFYDKSQRARENRTAKALMKLTEFYEKYNKTNFDPKPGLPRRHLYGSRNNMSFRAVITSITDTHKYNEIYLPWCIGMTTFEPMLKNKLMGMGYSPNDATALIYGHIEKYHPLLDRILENLIDETPDKGIGLLLERN